MRFLAAFRKITLRNPTRTIQRIKHALKIIITTCLTQCRASEDPDANVPAEWQQFHDRVSITYNALPAGYFGIFKEIADLIVTLGQSGLHIDSSFVPDISVGQHWARYWNDNDFDSKYDRRIHYEHNYPDYFPQAKSNPQEPWCYPESALGEFRAWFRNVYVGDGKLKKYLQNQAKVNALPASFAQLAISVLENKTT